MSLEIDRQWYCIIYQDKVENFSDKELALKFFTEVKKDFPNAELYFSAEISIRLE